MIRPQRPPHMAPETPGQPTGQEYLDRVDAEARRRQQNIGDDVSGQLTADTEGDARVTGTKPSQGPVSFVARVADAARAPFDVDCGNSRQSNARGR